MCKKQFAHALISTLATKQIADHMSHMPFRTVNLQVSSWTCPKFHRSDQAPVLPLSIRVPVASVLALWQATCVANNMFPDISATSSFPKPEKCALQESCQPEHFPGGLPEGSKLPGEPVKISATWKGCERKRWILRARATVCLSSSLSSSMPRMAMISCRFL